MTDQDVPYAQRQRERWYIFSMMHNAIQKHERSTGRKHRISSRINKPTNEFWVRIRLPWGWRLLNMDVAVDRQFLLDLCPSPAEKRKKNSLERKRDLPPFVLLRKHLMSPHFGHKQRVL